MVSLISSETDKDLLEIYGSDYQKITKEEQYVLATALTEGSVANNTIQLQLDKNPLEAGKLLYVMVDKKLLVSTNKGRWTTYSVNRDYKTNTNEKSRSKSQGVSELVWSKHQRKVLERLLQYCQEPRTLTEIAAQLGFADRYRMKKVYIDPLLGTEISMTEAKVKNAPNQKYVTIDTKENKD